MIQASEQFGNTIINTSRTFSARFLINGTEVNCDIEKIVCSKGACGEQILPGSVYVPYLEATLKSCSTSLDGVELEYQIGLEVSGSFEYISMGLFTIADIKAANGEVKLTAVGRLGTVGNDSFTSHLTYPTTIQSLLTELATFMDVPVTLKGLTATGTIEEAPSGACRDVVGLIAGLLGGFVTEDNSGNIVIAKYGAGETVPILPYRSIELPELNENGYEILGIKVIASEEQELSDGTIIPEVSYSYGNTITITQTNPFMTQALFNAMYPNIVGYSFTPGEVNMALGDPRLEPWDQIAVTDLSENTWNVPCLEIIHRFDGGFSTEVLANIASADTSAMQVKGAMTLEMERLRKGVYTASATAEQAIEDAAEAQTAVVVAQTAANNALTAAGNAQTAANAAQSSADAAAATASAAATSATNAASAASAAQTSANSATASANSALTQLSTVESVVGTLNWISEHGTYEVTTDTEVVSGKLYFTRSGSGTTADPYVYNVVTNPSGNPFTQGWYELDSVDEAVANYVSSHLALTNDGLYVTSGQNAWKVLVANDGIYIINPQGENAAKYKDAVTLGLDDGTKTYLQLDYHSMKLVSKEGSEFVYFSDLRNTSGIATLERTYVSDGDMYYDFGYSVHDVVSVIVAGNETNDYTIQGTLFKLGFNPSVGDNVIITAHTTDFITAFTIGSRASNYDVGPKSYVFGENCAATDTASFAEGMNSRAEGFAAHAEGGAHASGVESHAENSGTASGVGSHAEGIGIANGDYSHAEGTGIANGDYSHAEGRATQSNTYYTHVQNRGTIASSPVQTAIGRYNTEDLQGKFAVLVGNGDQSVRRTAFAITWDGNILLDLPDFFDQEIYPDGGEVNIDNTDSDALMTAITALGWTSEVIE